MKAIALLCLMLALSSSYPMLKASINQSFPDVYASILLGFGCGYLKEHNFGAFEFELSTDLGKLKVSVSDFTTGSVLMNFATSKFYFNEPNSIDFDIQELTANATYNYEYHYGLIRRKGSGSFDLQSTDFTAKTHFYTSVNNTLAFDIDELDWEIGKIKVNTGEGLIDDIINDFVNNDRKKFAEIINEAVLNYTSFINPYLNNLTYVYSLDAVNMMVDLHPDPDIKVVNGVLTGGLKAEFTNLKTKEVYPTYNESLPDTDSQSSDPIFLFASEYILDAPIKCLTEGFTYTISSLPPSFPLNLTTSSLAFMLPELRDTYGDNKNVHIILSGDPEAIQDVSIENGIFFDVSPLIDFKVETDQGLVQGLTLSMTISGKLSGGIKNKNGSAHLSYLAAKNIAVKESSVGPVDISVLTKLWQIIMNIVEKEVNGLFGSFDVPIPTIQYTEILDNAVAKNRYLEVAVNILPHF